MHFVAITHGSTGDTLPPAALLRQLQDRGHSVNLLASPAFETLAKEFRIPLTPIPPYGNEDVMAEAMRSISNYRLKQVLLVKMYELIASGAVEVESILRDALTSADALIVNSIFPFWTRVAQVRNIPTVSLHFCHEALPSTDRVPAPFLLPPRRLASIRRLVARQIWKSADQYLCRITTRALRGASVQSTVVPVLDFLYRPADFALIPLPASLFADPGLDLKVPSAFTGYLRRKPAPIPDPVRDRLEAFCRGERLPVIAFGSMRTDTIEADLRTFLAARSANQRCILIRGWGAIPSDLDPNEVLVLDPTPHEWVLPFASVFLHHGGAGTTAAGLVGGIPQLIRPFFADQPFWASEVRRLGCGGRAASFRRPQKIWRQLAAIGSDPGVKNRAHQIAETLAAESSPDPAETILDWITSS